MKLGMAQISASNDLYANMEKSIKVCRNTDDVDLLFFPEIQMVPFFPQYHDIDVEPYTTKIGDPIIQYIKQAAWMNDMYVSPNFYMDGFDRSLWINPRGEVEGTADMVHIFEFEHFYEQDYYKPSEDGFKVFETPFGRVGIVICFDRHIPESIRTCALKGADLVIIPTANTLEENMELFEWEIRVQAMQNSVFVAMCNRVGTEGDMHFAGESLVVDPYGNLIVKAGADEGVVTAELDLSIAGKKKKEIPWLDLRRPELYNN